MLAVLTICAIGWGTAPCQTRSEPMDMRHCLRITEYAQASGGWLLYCRPYPFKD